VNLRFAIVLALGLGSIAVVVGVLAGRDLVIIQGLLLWLIAAVLYQGEK